MEVLQWSSVVVPTQPSTGYHNGRRQYSLRTKYQCNMLKYKYLGAWGTHFESTKKTVGCLSVGETKKSQKNKLNEGRNNRQANRATYKGGHSASEWCKALRPSSCCFSLERLASSGTATAVSRRVLSSPCAARGLTIRPKE